MRKTALRLFKSGGRLLLNPYLKFESKKKKKINERLVEYAYVFSKLAEFYPARILDVGTGETALPHLISTAGVDMIAIDKISGYWQGNGFWNRHYYVHNRDVIRDQKQLGEYDAVLCISVLEHIPDHTAAVGAMGNCLKKGGKLIMTFPYNENTYIPNVYANTVPALSFITQVYSRKEINNWLALGFKISDQKYYKVFTGTFWNDGERHLPPAEVNASEAHHLCCITLEKI